MRFQRVFEYMRGLRRISRSWVRRPIRTVTSGKGIEIDVWDNYGLTGTAGAPANPGQAAGSYKDLIDNVTPRHNVAVVRPQTNAGATDAYAFVSKLPENFFGDIFPQAALVSAWEDILRQWEQKLYTGRYNIYRLVYTGNVTEGVIFPTVAIATAEWYLEKFKKDAVGSGFSDGGLHIQFWKSIKGQRPTPKQPANAPPPLRYPTMRQG